MLNNKRIFFCAWQTEKLHSVAVLCVKLGGRVLAGLCVNLNERTHVNSI